MNGPMIGLVRVLFKQLCHQTVKNLWLVQPRSNENDTDITQKTWTTKLIKLINIITGASGFFNNFFLLKVFSILLRLSQSMFAWIFVRIRKLWYIYLMNLERPAISIKYKFN